MKSEKAMFPQTCRSGPPCGVRQAPTITKNAVAMASLATVMAFGRVRRTRSVMARG